jgi:hypothetical protein
MNEKQDKKSSNGKEIFLKTTDSRNNLSKFEFGDFPDEAGLLPWRRCRRRGIIPLKENRP